MKAVETGNHEKCGAELRRAHRVAPGTYTFVHNQLGPLERLHTNESRAQQRRCKHQPDGGFLVTPVTIINGHGHRAGAGNQHKGHDGN